jgi:hypothetical protein
MKFVGLILVRFFLFVTLIPFASFFIRIGVDGLVFGNLVHGNQINDMASVFFGAILNVLLTLLPNIVFFLAIWVMSSLIGLLVWKKVVVWTILPACIVGLAYLCVGGGFGRPITIGVAAGAIAAAFIEYCIGLVFIRMQKTWEIESR